MDSKMKHEYLEVVKVYLNIIDVLLAKNNTSDRRLCIWTKGGKYGNFKVNTFKALLTDAVGQESYRKYMKIFRTFQWIICQPEKFSNIQWIEGKSLRVVTVDFEKYKLIKDLLGE